MTGKKGGSMAPRGGKRPGQGRKAGFKHTPATRRKIGAGVHRAAQTRHKRQG